LGALLAVVILIAAYSLYVFLPGVFLPGKKVVMRIGYIPIYPMAQYLIAREIGWLGELGPDVELRELSFSSGPPMMDAFAAGQIDIAYVGIVPALVAISRGIDAKVVAGNIIEPVGIMVSKEFAGVWETYRSGEAFKVFEKQLGRKFKFATLPKGSTPDIILRVFLAKLGLDPERDVEIVAMGEDRVQAALAAGLIDGTAIVEPLISIAEWKGWPYKTIVWSGEIIPGVPGAIVMVNGKFLRENGALVKKLIEIHLRATKLIRDDPKAAARLLSKALGESLLPEEVALKALQSPPKFSVDPRRLVPGTLAHIEHALKLGVLKSAPTVEQIFDFTLYDAVVKQKPEYAGL